MELFDAILKASLYVVILITCLFDGWRDTLIHRRPDVSWRKYHIVKWISFYPPLFLLGAWVLLGEGISWSVLPKAGVLSLLAGIFWYAGSHVLGGVTWESQWILLGKRLLRRVGILKGGD